MSPPAYLSSFRAGEAFAQQFISRIKAIACRQMHILSPAGFFSENAGPFAIIVGANEIASAISVRLSWERFRVVLSHDPFPPVIRRGMAFHDALYDDRAVVDGILGKRADTSPIIDGDTAVTRGIRAFDAAPF